MFLLDANAFIEASRFYYGFDIAPGFWSWIDDPAVAGRLASVEAVKDELTAGAGDLVVWTRARTSSFWLPASAGVVRAMAQLSQWAASPQRKYRPEAADAFLSSADFPLIAHAMAIGATVVTREQPAPHAKRSIKIPDVCDAFDVPWTDPFSAYRALGLRLAA